MSVPASLSDLQRQVLLVLLDQERETPTNIAYRMGFQPFYARGRSSRAFSPAQKIIGPLNGLRSRGLIGSAGRRDGRSGTAYILTTEGKRVAEALRDQR